jgi:hypothetical protein
MVGAGPDQDMRFTAKIAAAVRGTVGLCLLVVCKRR